ncbi:hypothetical protein SCB29_40500, partial [Paraburkholderia sp. SIMBA_055]
VAENPDHAEIAAEFARLRAVSPGLSAAVLRELVVGTFCLKWSMFQDEVAEVVDSYLALKT